MLFVVTEDKRLLGQRKPAVVVSKIEYELIGVVIGGMLGVTGRVRCVGYRRVHGGAVGHLHGTKAVCLPPETADNSCGTTEEERRGYDP